jgi:hypothetical protein
VGSVNTVTPGVCVNSTSDAPSLSPTADYRVPGAVLSRHLGATVNKIKDATLTSPGAQGRPLAKILEVEWD